VPRLPVVKFSSRLRPNPSTDLHSDAVIAGVRPASTGLELAWGAALLVAGLVPRLLLAVVLPAQPISDFRGIIDFALALRDKGLTTGGYYWDVFNIGPPLVLSWLLRVWPGSPDDAARLATAAVTGLMPLLPFLLWRGALPLRTRVIAGMLLALWPGQVLFSGVVSQDNWVTVPTVALAALAARAWFVRKGYPVAAGLLYAISVAMRQEMLYALLILVLVAAGLLPSRQARWWRAATVCLLSAALPLLLHAWQRKQATGAFSIGPGHLGYTLVGTVMPGATATGWGDPSSYATSVAPELTRSRYRLFHETLPIALAEVRRRPGFQLARATAAFLRHPITSGGDNLYWSLTAPGVQGDRTRARALKLALAVQGPLTLEAILIQGLFAGALLAGCLRRNVAIISIALAALAKIAIHAALVAVGRFFVPALAMELLVVALGVEQALRMSLQARLGLLTAGVLASATMVIGGGRLTAWVRSHDEVAPQRTYRFTLRSWQHRGSLECTVRTGELQRLGNDMAAIAPVRPPAGCGVVAAADCLLRGGGPAEALALEVLDDYSGVAGPGTVLQRVAIDGTQVAVRDAAADASTDWWSTPLGNVGSDTLVRVRTEALLRCGAGAGIWPTAGLDIQLVRQPEGR